MRVAEVYLVKKAKQSTYVFKRSNIMILKDLTLQTKDCKVHCGEAKENPATSCYLSVGEDWR